MSHFFKPYLFRNFFILGIELVQAFKRELRQANDWFKEARDILDNGKKVSLEKMKSLIAYGDKIKVLPNDELKLLKQQQKMSKTWAARVKKILPVDDSDVVNQELRRLITEYDISLIEMPDEIAALRKATSCYCICRESFSTGLMVACDVSHVSVINNFLRYYFYYFMVCRNARSGIMGLVLVFQLLKRKYHCFSFSL